MTVVGDSSTVADDLAAAALTLARRFAAGATMWCVSPRWPAHARHIAVEFVHPVIVGKRALPAVAVENTELVDALRLLVRPGDVIAAVGDAGDDVLHEVLWRAEPWGLTTVLIGAGPRPPAGIADHVLSIDDPARATFSGGLVLLYHLLWELTHVVFEHPGLLTPQPVCAEETCITCSDEGRLAEVARVREDGRAEVVAAGERETVDVSLIDPVRPGELVLVHAGVALTTVSEVRR
jgi:HupF/HypC family